MYLYVQNQFNPILIVIHSTILYESFTYSNTSNRLSDIDNSYRHRCRNYSYNISSQGSQTENACILLYLSDDYS